eukprot:3304788-Pyramimonas_sp.AAC.1
MCIRDSVPTIARSGFPRARPCGAVDLSARLSRASLAGNPAGVVAAGVPAMAADSAGYQRHLRACRRRRCCWVWPRAWRRS